MSKQFDHQSPVAFGGMMVALSILLAAGTKIFPVLIGAFAAIPLALAAFRLSLRNSIITGVAACILIGIFFGPLFGAAFLFEYAILGVFTGYAIQRNWTFSRIFLIAWGLQCIGMLAFLGIQIVIAGFQIDSVLQPFMNMEDDMMRTAKDMGLFERLQTTAISADTIEKMFAQSVQFFMRVLPAVYVCLMAVGVALHLLFFQVLCVRLHIPVEVKMPPYDQTIMPVQILVPFVFCWLALLLHQYIDDDILWIVALNGMVICVGCMCVGGLSLILNNIHWRKLAAPFRMLYFIVFFFMGQYFLIVATVVGVFDTILDFRHLRMQAKEQ